MASIVQRPLNRFRKTDHHRTFHERWGDLAISAPTDGSWNQLDASNGSLSTKRHSRYNSVTETHRSRGACIDDDDDDTIHLTDDPSAPSRRNSFSMRTLNPRRLSMRLAPRPKTPAEGQKDKEHPPSPREKRTEFAYKPIHQDYPSEVAEKVARQNPSSSARFRYIPANSGYAGSPEPASHKSSSIPRVAGAIGLPERGAKQRSSSRGLALDNPRGDDLQYSDKNRGGTEYGQRAGFVSTRNASSSTGRKAARSSRYTTMTMVPDPEDIYG
ncbi:hypothetical protein BDV59DRAFT_76437 [Aspergillus ambiguus]|uniref:uncharacterized protein n=1 Tax=Aspergillus ambiguus TaxID=176160 RepID=UPI003CCCC031